jgi:hypothetical protein
MKEGQDGVLKNLVATGVESDSIITASHCCAVLCTSLRRYPALRYPYHAMLITSIVHSSLALMFHNNSDTRILD